jgi:hypothetical protein
MTISSISTIAANAIATYRNVDTLLSEDDTLCNPELVASVPSVPWMLWRELLVDEKPLLTLLESWLTELPTDVTSLSTLFTDVWRLPTAVPRLLNDVDRLPN